MLGDGTVTCDSSSVGYDDWFLPRKAEMEEMVKVLYNQYNPLSTFEKDTLYWTSAEFNDTEAYQ
jgi:hypothetical protein